jgi:hypothetical protein
MSNTHRIAALALLLLAGACTSGSAPDPSMSLNQVVSAMVMTPTDTAAPYCELELKRNDEPRSTKWYSCDFGRETYASLPIGVLDEEDYWRAGGLAREAHFRLLHGASIELPALLPSSPAARMGWREGDRLEGLALLERTLVANLERDGRRLVLLYDFE